MAGECYSHGWSFGDDPKYEFERFSLNTDVPSMRNTRAYQGETFTHEMPKLFLNSKSAEVLLPITNHQ